jgi:hypothetical protein
MEWTPEMSRSSRPPLGFRPVTFELEGRLLLTSGHSSAPVGNYVQFRNIPGSGSPLQAEVVGQQDGSVTVFLARTRAKGTLTVHVTTDPASPAVGVNVGAVDQTLTFTRGQSSVAVTVPILAGALNPGEVDVNLNVTPLTPHVQSRGPLQFQILANTTTPPRILSLQGKPEGIVVRFSKAMDPAGATNLNNYQVQWSTVHHKHKDIGPLAILKPGPWGPDSSTSLGTVKFQSAQYDPATDSVTLIPMQHLNYSTAKFSVWGGELIDHSDQSNTGPRLTDLQGNPIATRPGALAGAFAYMVDVNLKPATNWYPSF